jgi:hypothetical protein
MAAIINRDAIDEAASVVCMAYEKIAPTVSEWADWLYSAKDREVTLEDLFTLQRISDELPAPNYAANLVYHLMERQGKATVGHAGF